MDANGAAYLQIFGDPLQAPTPREERVLEILVHTLTRRLLFLSIDNGMGLEAKRRILINEFAVASAAVYQGRLTIDVEKQLVGFLGRGFEDYELAASTIPILILEAKQKDLNPGTVQLAAELTAVYEVNLSIRLLIMQNFEDKAQKSFIGVVTNGEDWRFVRLDVSEPKRIYFSNAGATPTASAFDVRDPDAFARAVGNLFVRLNSFVGMQLQIPSVVARPKAAVQACYCCLKPIAECAFQAYWQ